MTVYKDGFPAASPCTRFDGRARAALIVGAGHRALYIAPNYQIQKTAKALAEMLGRTDLYYTNAMEIGDGHRWGGIQLGGIVVDPYIEGLDLERIPFSFLRTLLRWVDTSVRGPLPAGSKSPIMTPPPSVTPPDTPMAERRQRVIELLEKRGHKPMWGSNTGTMYPGARLHVAGKILDVADELFEAESNYGVVNYILKLLDGSNAHEVRYGDEAV